MEYCLGFKKKEILQHATIWRKLEDIILSEISQLQKDKYCMIHDPTYMKYLKIVKFMEAESRRVVVRA